MNQYGSLAYIAILVVAFYLLIIRPQQTRQRQHAQMLAALEVGDTIITAGGIRGVVREIDTDTVRVEIAEGITVDLEKGAVARRVGAS